MSQDDSQERTEEPTEKKKKDSKKKGSIARSKELNTTLILIGSGFALIIFGGNLAISIMGLAEQLFTMPLHAINVQNGLFELILNSFHKTIISLMPIFFLLFVCTLIGSLLVGGWTFSGSSLAPKFERLDPIKGLGKIISIKSGVELIKSILKFVLVSVAAVLLVRYFMDKFLGFSFLPIEESVINSLTTCSWAFLLISCTLLIVTAIDVPYQIWDRLRQIKMTRQELKDELKDSEGNPEIKAKIGQLRKELAKRRMMSEIETADVVITNPTHFAIALKYDEGKMQAPKVVAKGMDLVAGKIREIAEFHKVPIVCIPPLARALHYNTDLGEEIPTGLYVAVAQVLTYIYRLSLYTQGKVIKPKPPVDLDIPTEFQR